MRFLLRLGGVLIAGSFVAGMTPACGPSAVTCTGDSAPWCEDNTLVWCTEECNDSGCDTVRPLMHRQDCGLGICGPAGPTDPTIACAPGKCSAPSDCCVAYAGAPPECDLGRCFDGLCGSWGKQYEACVPDDPRACVPGLACGTDERTDAGPYPAYVCR